MYRADHEIVEREVDALIALAERAAKTEFCANCAAQITLETLSQNFCPSCGTKRQSNLLPEIELLQIVAATRRGQRAALTGAIVIFSSIAAFSALAMIAGYPIAVLPALIFCAAQIVGWLTFASGIRSTQKALAASSEKAVPAPEQFDLPGRNQKPGKLSAAPLSVTEDSTRRLATPPTTDL